MLVTFPHEVRFTNEKTLSVRDVANSLLANEQIVLGLGQVLELCIDGLEVTSIKVDFVSATINSPLKEALAAGILVSFQEKLTHEVPALIEKITGVHVDDHYRTLVTVLFLIVVMYGIEQAYEMFKRKLHPQEPQHLPQIQGNFNTVINVGGDLVGVEPSRLIAAIEKTYSGKKRLPLVRQVLAFIHPAKAEKGTAIEGAGLTIEPATIDAAPSDLDFEMGAEVKAPESMNNRQIIIHATDLDHTKTGWAGHIPGFWDRRIPMKLASGVETSRLFGKNTANADVVVTYKIDNTGDDVPEAMFVYKIYD